MAGAPEVIKCREIETWRDCFSSSELAEPASAVRHGCHPVVIGSQGARHDFSVKIPLHPFFSLGVRRRAGEGLGAHFGGARAIRRQHGFSPQASVDNTAYFPVNVKGGLLYVGDVTPPWAKLGYFYVNYHQTPATRKDTLPK